MRRTSTEAAPRAPEHRGGFTLLEVLAAVAILGIWYTVIATGALRGLRSEGENIRQIRASLVADEQLAEIEAGLLVGTPLELLEDEIEEEEFTIRIAVTEFVPEGEEPESGLAGLIATEQAATLEFLRAVRVEVAWQEGVEEYSIQRETFAFDREAWGAFIQSQGAILQGEGEQEGEEGQGEGESDNPLEDDPLAERDDESES